MKGEAHWVRAVRYLAKYRPEDVEYSAPWELTQEGIAEALGITRAHAALLLKRMADRGLSESTLAYIKGEKRRRLVYRLTQEGVSVRRSKFF